MRVLLRYTIAMSAMPFGEVVNVPRSRTERAPSSFWRIVSRGMSLGGAPAVSENGPANLRSLEVGSQSKTLMIVLRVPPLAPEDLEFG